MLEDRKKNILKIIIDDYVFTGEPIGSRTISKKYDFGLSPATIRNEMSDLEEMGYLFQPHTSSGRIPSDKGYRLYVDELMKLDKLSKKEIAFIREVLIEDINQAQEIVRRATSILSMLTHYTTIATMPSIRENTIKHIQLIPIDMTSILLVIVTESGVVKNNMIRLQSPIENDFIVQFSNILNQKLLGLAIENITLTIIQQIQREMKENKEILLPILDIISEILNNIEDDNYCSEGVSNILNYPEYSDTSKAKEFLDLIRKKDSIQRILKEDANQDIRISIGKENSFDEIDECSLISTTYIIGDKTIGTIGVIGPKRMDYSKVVSTINIIRNHIDKIFRE